MAAIRSRDTRPEVWIRKKLFARGYRYRKNVSHVPGHPDVWLARYNTAVFVNGCFWHRHRGCKYAYMPKSRTDFWAEKFDRNIKRDDAVRQQLKSAGIRMLVVWECTIKKMMKDACLTEDTVNLIEGFLKSEDSFLEL